MQNKYEVILKLPNKNHIKIVCLNRVTKFQSSINALTLHRTLIPTIITVPINCGIKKIFSLIKDNTAYTYLYILYSYLKNDKIYVIT